MRAGHARPWEDASAGGARGAARKHPGLVLAPALACAALGAGVLLPWRRELDLGEPALALVSGLSGLVWLGVLWWALHHLGFQLAALFRRPSPALPAASAEECRRKFVLLYLTRDDFLPGPCRSCLEQEYPAECFRVLLCDDGETEAARAQVEAFAAAHPGVEVLRRPDRRGFKAGNINHAWRTGTTEAEGWLVLVDADQTLPGDYLAKLAAVVARVPPEVAFVQGALEPEELRPGTEAGAAGPAAADFQGALGVQIQSFYERDLDARNGCGLVACFGHGVALRRAALERLGGVPEVVSEDYALALALRRQGWVGRYAAGWRSWEAAPKDFGAFVVRTRKFAAGSAELVRGHLPGFLLAGRGAAPGASPSWVERLDAAMLVAWFPLAPVLLVNGWVSAWVGHRLWAQGAPVLHPLLAYLLLAMFLLNLPVLASLGYGAGPLLRSWFWTTALHTAVAPIAAVEFLRHWRRAPAFLRTPKGAERSPRFAGWAWVLAGLGLGTLWLAGHWWSPFSLILVGWGCAFLSFPLYHRLTETGSLAAWSRVVVLLPGLAYLGAIWAMWRYGYV